MKYSFTIVILFISLQSFSQECNKELLAQKPGIWKASPKGSEGGTAAELANEKKTIAAIHTY
ncbi:MAG: hypothetical protein E6H07_11860 [Bacteroidetes bacterium]|nr:MAG: hypothetical protein E6H07_11860 [Bacteroidota bacterium]